MEHLLAVDLGVKTGLALFDSGGTLLWYRSRNYGNKQRLRTDIQNVINDIPSLRFVFIEGGGDIARLWLKECRKRKIHFRQIYAEDWRKDLFDPKEMRTGEQAKQKAIILAKQVIDQCQGPKPTSMLDDAAEAVLVGYWGMIQVEWIDVT